MADRRRSRTQADFWHPTGRKDTYRVGRVRGDRRLRRRVRIGAPDPSLTRCSGMVAVTELVDRLDVIGLLDAAIGPIKQRGTAGYTGGQLLVGMAAAQLAGEDFLVGLDRQRADVAGQALAPVPGLALDDRGRAGAAVHRRAVARRWRPGSATSHAAVLARAAAAAGRGAVRRR